MVIFYPFVLRPIKEKNNTYFFYFWHQHLIYFLIYFLALHFVYVILEKDKAICKSVGSYIVVSLACVYNKNNWSHQASRDVTPD